jgi:hypothetical protein
MVATPGLQRRDEPVEFEQIGLTDHRSSVRVTDQNGTPQRAVRGRPDLGHEPIVVAATELYEAFPLVETRRRGRREPMGPLHRLHPLHGV